MAAGCPPEAHLHPCPPTMVVFHGALVVLDEQPVAMIPAQFIAVGMRICALLNEHGLVGVPDTLASTFDPPTGPAAFRMPPPDGLQ